MQESTSPDIDTQHSSSPEVGGKKAKLDDGSPRDPIPHTDVDNKNGEFNVGGSDETPEISCSAIPGPNTSFESSDIPPDPPDDVDTMAPSTSDHSLLNIKRESGSRNYGKTSADRDAENNVSTNDSESQPVEVTPTSSRQASANNTASNIQITINDNQRQVAWAASAPGVSGISMVLDDPDPTSDDEVEWPTSQNQNDEKIPAVLLKERPKHNYSILKEVLNRELGLSFPRGKTTMEDVTFAQRFCASLHAVFRMEKLHTLQKHNACVNCISFHPEGRLLVSGSDDTHIIVWDWARKIPLHTVNTDHKSNVFQSKFIDLNSSSQLNIVTCGRDGQVRLSQCSSAGGSWSQRRLAGHGKAANKLHVIPLEPHSVLSAGEDGFVLHCDLRSDTVNKLLKIRERNAAIALYSLHGHPFEPKQLVVAGRDKFIRVYDRRKSDRPVGLYSPTVFTEEINIDKKTMRLSTMHLTCAIYNHDGTEILGSYNDDDIYLFNIKNDVYTKGVSSKEKKGYSFRYTGHRNSATLKSVSFYGPKSEYIVSGSDCGHMYIWEKNTESIVQWLQGDANGMVNSVEPHPQFPILASGGLDKDVKIWAPHSDEDPTYQGLSNTIRNNCASQWQTPLFNDFLPTLYRSWRSENRLGVTEEDAPYYGQIELEANICTTF